MGSAERTGADVIAEGIETESQLDALRATGHPTWSEVHEPYRRRTAITSVAGNVGSAHDDDHHLLETNSWLQRTAVARRTPLHPLGEDRTMSAPERPSRTSELRDIDVPTVTKMRRAERCTGPTRGAARHERCPVYADTALDGHVLCRQHLAQALLPTALRERRDADSDRGRLRAVLEQVLAVLDDGVPDPAADQLLALVPSTLIGRIEDALTRDRREGLGGRGWRLWAHLAGASARGSTDPAAKSRRR